MFRVDPGEFSTSGRDEKCIENCEWGKVKEWWNMKDLDIDGGMWKWIVGNMLLECRLIHQERDGSQWRLLSTLLNITVQLKTGYVLTDKTTISLSFATCWFSAELPYLRVETVLIKHRVKTRVVWGLQLCRCASEDSSEDGSTAIRRNVSN